MDRVILGKFSRGVLDKVRETIDPLQDYINFISEDEAQVLAEGIFCFKKTLGRLYFYLNGCERDAVCIAFVRNKNDMVVAIEGFMITFIYRK